MRVILTVFLLCGLAPAADNGALVERVGDTGFIQLASDSFHGLTPRQKELAWWLSQASIAVDPIIYDQLSRFGLRQKAVLEMIVAHPEGVDPAALAKILSFTKLFWANRGNHNEMSARKFLPEFTYEELRAAGLAALGHRAKGMMSEAQFLSELDALRPALFDAEFEPMITAKSPRGGLDILQASANNFYEGVSLADLTGFTEHYPLNSRLAKMDGALHEEVYRAGTPDGSVPPGRYAQYLQRANQYLARAQQVAEPAQAKAIGDLIRFYQTGDPKDWLQFGADWVRNNATVDFANGFIEVYRDARGAKGTSQSFVTITDQRVNSLMLKVAANAQYFENKAPWADQYKKQGVQPPMAKAVEALIETGDFSVTTVGDNLPNEDEIHEKYGSKSFLFTGSSRALNHATGVGPFREFSWNDGEFHILEAHADEAEDLMTALHEIIGHGSGKLNPKLTEEPAFYLKQYYSTLEEARADLMALWNVWDPRLRELGLISSPEVAKAMYYRAAMAPLIQLRRDPKGDTLEEDHERDRQLIVEYIADKTGGISKKVRDGRMYYYVDDFEKMRQGVGLLLAELMRIKAEGDYDAIKALIDRYGVHFDPALRDQVVERYKKLGLPSYWAGINPELDADVSADGAVHDVRVTYPGDVVRQYLRYSAMYDRRLQ
ncbi:MAG: peptidase M49 [Bryobacteraceae bacterium]|jgi:dipeptidyl-peptidase-3